MVLWCSVMVSLCILHKIDPSQKELWILGIRQSSLATKSSRGQQHHSQNSIHLREYKACELSTTVFKSVFWTSRLQYLYCSSSQEPQTQIAKCMDVLLKAVVLNVLLGHKPLLTGDWTMCSFRKIVVKEKDIKSCGASRGQVILYQWAIQLCQEQPHKERCWLGCLTCLLFKW